MREQPATLTPEDTLYRSLELFRLHQCNVLPVVARKTRNWLGMLTRRTRVRCVRKQRNAMAKEHIIREHAGLFTIEQDAQLEEFMAALAPLQNGTLQRLMVPLDIVGQSIRQSQFQRRFGHQVVAIEAADGTLQSPPDLDRPLKTGDRLLAIVELAGKAGATPASTA